MRRHSALTVILAAALLATLPATALGADQPTPVPVAGTTELIHGGTGNQTDPHISGSLVSYTNITTSREIRYHDLDTAANSAIPNGGHQDSLSDVSGTTIVFGRVFSDVSTRAIMAYDTASPASPPVELDPVPGTRRVDAAIGGRTVAWRELAPGSTTLAKIVVYDLDTAVAAALTDDTEVNRDPAVSPDGGVVAFMRCETATTGCDVYASTRYADGTWTQPQQITGAEGEDREPDTNGEFLTWSSDAAGDFDIFWAMTDGTVVRALHIDGQQTNPNMAGSLIAFESVGVDDTSADLFVWDLSTSTLYQVTDTPAVSEVLNDISVAADGSVRVVHVQADGISAGSMDVFVTTFRLASGPSYEVCPLFDQTRAFKLGSTAPIKLQLCDPTGANLSSAELSLTVTGLVQKDVTATTAIAEDSGNANPDSAFRYDASLAGYIYNLSTRALNRGTWELRFTVSGDPTTYVISFDLR